MRRMALPLALTAAVAVAAFVATAGRKSGDAPLPERPRRIVSIVPSVTELLFAAGAGAEVIGVSDWCDWPPEARTRPRVGGLKVNLERIAGLRPDLIVSSDDLAGRTNAELKKAGYPMLAVDPHGFADIAAALRRLGTMTGHEEGERAAADLERRVAAVADRVRSAAERPTVYLEASSQPHTAAPGMVADEVIQLAGGRNVFAETTARKWVPVSWEAVVARDPDVIVVVHDFPPPASSRPGYSAMKAARTGRVATFPKEQFMYPTPRLVEGLERLARFLHPERFDGPAK